MVMMKRTDPKVHPDELGIARLFSAAPLAGDPRNHCVPLLDAFRMPHDAETTLVFPFLRPWFDHRFEDPAFATVGEGVAFTVCSRYSRCGALACMRFYVMR